MDQKKSNLPDPKFHVLTSARWSDFEKLCGKPLEGYPVEPRKERMPAAFACTGLASAFRRAGFVEIARRSKTRPIMRFSISKE
ncbi:MAG: hypothetical protein GTO24_21110 [candidate division Zixibacteria bacterium]|nr:hypothetical protein [candidate division Zixibacteria bacterium]